MAAPHRPAPPPARRPHHLINILILVLLALVLLAAFVALHRYAWRRLVRDTTAPRSRLRRAGTVVFIAGPLLGPAAIRDDMPGIPFAWEGIIDWPGFLGPALFLHLVLALAVGEAVRPLPARWLARRDGGGAASPAPGPPAHWVAKVRELGLRPLENGRPHPRHRPAGPPARRHPSTPCATASTCNCPATPTAAGSGRDRCGDTQLYVSRGVGVRGPPVRVGAPSNLTVVELASRQA